MKIKKVLVTVSCLWITVCTVQTLGLARRTNRPPAQPTRPDFRSLRGLTGEQRGRAINELVDNFREQRQKAAEERDKLNRKESWKWALKINEQQWRKIEPILDRILALSKLTDSGARGWRFSELEQRFYWHKHSEGQDLTKANTPNIVIERNKIADELIDLLEDESSKDEDIRKKIDQLQKLKERARKELPLVKKELAALPMTARQEAVLLITCRIE